MQADRESADATERMDGKMHAACLSDIGIGKTVDECSQAVPARGSSDSSVDDDRPFSAHTVGAPPHQGWLWANTAVVIFFSGQLAGLLYSATFPLREGGQALPRPEYMPYWRRLLSVLVVRMVSTSGL